MNWSKHDLIETTASDDGEWLSDDELIQYIELEQLQSTCIHEFEVPNDPEGDGCRL